MTWMVVYLPRGCLLGKRCYLYCIARHKGIQLYGNPWSFKKYHSICLSSSPAIFSSDWILYYWSSLWINTFFVATCASACSQIEFQSMDVKEGTRGAAGEGHSLVYPGAMQIPRCRSFEAFFPGPPTHTLYSLLVCRIEVYSII